MSDDIKNSPLEFPNSNSTEENRQDSTSETEPVTSDKKYGPEWTPDMLQIMADHGLDPNSIENVEELENDEEEADKSHKIGEFPSLTHPENV